MNYKNCLFGFFLLISSIAHGQFGVNVLYSLPSNSSDWDIINNDESLQAAGIGGSIDYWWKLKNYRVEFLGELGYAGGGQEINSTQYDWQQFHLLLNTNIYIFDFEGDCNCPTFGKDGSLFEKGFYLQIGAGAANFSAENSTADLTTSGSAISGLFHVGAGLDIGVAEYFTITPWIRYYYRLPLAWGGLEQDGSLIEDGDAFTSASTGVMAGIRLGYRLDYKRR